MVSGQFTKCHKSRIKFSTGVTHNVQEDIINTLRIQSMGPWVIFWLSKYDFSIDPKKILTVFKAG